VNSFSLLFPQQPTDPAAVLAFAEVVRDHGFDRLWMGQSFGIESHLALAALAGSGAEVPVGIGTALAALRTPYDAALQARSLASLLGRSVAVGYGAADPDFVTSVRGAPLRRPASYTAEYARIVGSLIAGDHTTSEVEGLAMSARLPALAHPPVEVGTGVLRPVMAAKSRDVVDFVVTWLTPRTYVRDVLRPALVRPDGSCARIVTNVQCAVARPGRDARMLAQAGAGGHLSRDHYTAMLRSAGLDVDVSDPVSGARELVRRGVFVHGGPDDIADELRRHLADGVDEVVVNVTAVALVHGVSEALSDLVEIGRSLQHGEARHAAA
jgi:alkanesulfonate monooxygenase SsuD/methylene tetrahydromethanopterin reductase-like flavin-dependent oxidoreductase (luciferase family)